MGDAPLVTTVEELAALLQLASPALPVGAFSYSQGLESAIHSGLVHDAPTARGWMEDGLRWVIGHCELPVFFRQFDNWTIAQEADLEWLDRWFVASRETRELREETEQIAWALTRIAFNLEIGDEERRRILKKIKPTGFPTIYAFVACGLRIRPRAAATAYCFAWLENQVSAAIKAIPLGQSDGQKILAELRSTVSAVVGAGHIPIDQATTFAPYLAILSARHENQYTRLFRS
jgi:urease accessory protein